MTGATTLFGEATAAPQTRFLYLPLRHHEQLGVAAPKMRHSGGMRSRCPGQQTGLMRAYFADLRTRIVVAVEGGLNPVATAHRFTADVRTVRHYGTQQRQPGDRVHRPSPGRMPGSVPTRPTRCGLRSPSALT